MKHCLVFAHPSINSFNGAILHTYRTVLEEQGHEVKIRNVNKMEWNPILSWKEYEDQFDGLYAEDVLREHALIKKSDALTLIYPVWWAGLPARAKGYLDRVFAYGFGYKLNAEDPIPLLKGKKAATIFTSGSPEKLYRESGMEESLKQMIKEGLFDFCGFQTVGQLYFGNVILASDEERENMLKKVRELALKF